MDTQRLYNQWSATYDEVDNKTRDLEKKAGQRMLSTLTFRRVLELGCGTGKNTQWLAEKAAYLQAVDLSEAMMAKAKAKVTAAHVHFAQADITGPWNFVSGTPDLVTCSLILEHIKDLRFVFQQASTVLRPGGGFYVCELHPYKQYGGSKARFETSEGLQVLECFVHHASDYFAAATANGFACERLDEWFDEDDRSQPPRLISFLFRRK